MNTVTAGTDRILVVVGPDTFRSEQPLDSSLLKRAANLAETLGSALELFHVTHDSGAEALVLASQDDALRVRKELADRDASRLAEIAAWLTDRGLAVTYDCRWDAPRTDAILRKIVESKPDIVLKTARDHSYVLGLATHTDWELARRSPADVWLVGEEAAPIRRIVAAVGNTLGNSDDVTTTSDHELLVKATAVRAAFEAELDLVNAYQAPSAAMMTAATTVDPVPSTAIPPERHDELVELVVGRHDRAIRDLARQFDIDGDHVHVTEGHAEAVIIDVANTISADLVVMGANDLNRLERFLEPVTVEPVIAGVGCDIFIMRAPDGPAVSDRTPAFVTREAFPDLAEAIVNPQAMFGSPREVAALEHASVELRQRILQAWEYDIRAAMVEEDEGGPVRDIDAGALREIERARSALDAAGDGS